MGTYSRYSLAVLNADTGTPYYYGREVVEVLRAESEEAEYALADDGSASNQSSRWYNCQQDLRAFSIRYPGVVFQLDKLQEDGEYSRIYACEGRAYREVAEIVYQPFAASKLQ